MIKYKNLNNISDTLLKQIPRLESGQEVVFQMLNGHQNNDNDRNERERNPVLFGKTQIQTKLRIKDPGTGNTVDIGVPMAVENDTVMSYRPFLAGIDDGLAFKGKFSLIGGNIQDEEFYEIFWLSPEREGSPCADLRVKPLFKIVNHKEETQKSIGRVATLKKALNDLDTLEPEDIINFGASQNWTETDSESILGKINEFAKSKPDQYLKIREDKDTIIKSTIKKALDKNILTYDAITGNVLVGESLVMVVNKDSKEDYLGSIARWVNSAKNGQQVYDGIQKQLAG